MLSIPAFRWFYFEDPDTRARVSGSTCQVIGPHFIRFGGWNYYGPKQATGPTCMNPVSIFDLNSFTWTDAFDPAATYKSPTKVEAWNVKNANPVSGWDDGVKALFAGINSTTTNTPPPNTSSQASKPAPSTLPKTLGGALGGLVIVALFLGGILVCVKRRKKRLEKENGFNRFELAHEPTTFVAEMPANQAPVELSAIPELLMTPIVNIKGKKQPPGS